MPGPPPLGSWGASRELPGGGSRPKVCGSELGEPPFDSHQNSCRFGHRFLIVLGSILGPSWGSCWDHFGPWSAEVGPRTLFESSYLRKSDFSRNLTFSYGLGTFFPQDGAQDGPRSPQDRSKIVLDRFFFLLIFRFDF